MFRPSKNAMSLIACATLFVCLPGNAGQKVEYRPAGHGSKEVYRGKGVWMIRLDGNATKQPLKSLAIRRAAEFGRAKGFSHMTFVPAIDAATAGTLTPLKRDPLAARMGAKGSRPLAVSPATECELNDCVVYVRYATECELNDCTPISSGIDEVQGPHYRLDEVIKKYGVDRRD